MGNLGFILLCLAIGAILGRLGSVPRNTPAALNSFVMSVSLPALALLSFHDVQLDRALFFPISMPWIVFIGAWCLFEALSRTLGWARRTTGALLLTAGLGNTSFVGFPLLTAIYGPEALKTGVIVDQGGSFLVLSSLGVLAAAYYASHDASATRILGRIFRFPPFVATLAALALHETEYPATLRQWLVALSSPLVPLALVSVGMQLSLNTNDTNATNALRKRAGHLATGLFYKLALAPALILLLFVFVLGARGPEIQVTIAQAAMAPMITGAILATDHDLDPSLARLMLAVGIPLSLVTVPLWARLLSTVAAG